MKIHPILDINQDFVHKNGAICFLRTNFGGNMPLLEVAASAELINLDHFSAKKLCLESRD